MDNSLFWIFLQLIGCRHCCNFRLYFLRRRCPGQSVVFGGLKIGIEVGKGSLICTWVYDFSFRNFDTCLTPSNVFGP